MGQDAEGSCLLAFFRDRLFGNIFVCVHHVFEAAEEIQVEPSSSKLSEFLGAILSNVSVLLDYKSFSGAGARNRGGRGA